MSREELSLFSYEILGLVGRTGAGAHDLLRLARRGRMLDWAGESQYYAEPKRLAALGYLDARKEPGKTTERTVYTLNQKGLDALRAYARTPVRFTPVKSDPLLRLLIADLVGEGPTRASIATLRDDIADLSVRLDEGEASAELLPHRRKYLLIVIGFLRRLLDLHLELVDEVERELARGSASEAAVAQGDSGGEARGLPAEAPSSPPATRPRPGRRAAR
jgi:DNA-binding PadR family transcriptional regulator